MTIIRTVGLGGEVVGAVVEYGPGIGEDHIKVNDNIPLPFRYGARLLLGFCFIHKTKIIIWSLRKRLRRSKATNLRPGGLRYYVSVSEAPAFGYLVVQCPKLSWLL